jgi:hypothetical protein
LLPTELSGRFLGLGTEATRRLCDGFAQVPPVTFLQPMPSLLADLRR